MNMNHADPIRMFLCGDVMTGRGIVQLLPHPGDPPRYESYARDARKYAHLAEIPHGPIPRPVGFDYIWGDALVMMDPARTDVRSSTLRQPSPRAMTSGAANLCS